MDIINSQSVLKHVDDLEQTYASLYSWLRVGGMMSHQIDFKSHGLSKRWNGYRACPEFLWKITYGKRPFLINRQPYSVHRQFFLDNGFELVAELPRMQDGGITRAELAPRWKNISDEDLNCSGAFFVARKNEGHVWTP